MLAFRMSQATYILILYSGFLIDTMTAYDATESTTLPQKLLVTKVEPLTSSQNSTSLESSPHPSIDTHKDNETGTTIESSTSAPLNRSHISTSLKDITAPPDKDVITEPIRKGHSTSFVTATPPSPSTHTHIYKETGASTNILIGIFVVFFIIIIIICLIIILKKKKKKRYSFDRKHKEDAGIPLGNIKA